MTRNSHRKFYRQLVREAVSARRYYHRWHGSPDSYVQYGRSLELFRLARLHGAEAGCVFHSPSAVRKILLSKDVEVEFVRKAGF